MVGPTGQLEIWGGYGNTGLSGNWTRLCWFCATSLNPSCPEFAGENASNCKFLTDFAFIFFIVNWVLYFAFGCCVSNGKFINDKINGYRVAPKK